MRNQKAGPQCRKLWSNAAVAGATEDHSEAKVGRNEISGLDGANKEIGWSLFTIV